MYETHLDTERNDKDVLENQIKIINNNPVISGLLRTISGLIVILDEKREIVGLNSTFLKLIGIDDPEKVLGLRLGEAVSCKFANKSTDGCGTTKYCSTCGAAIAIMASLSTNEVIEKVCSIETQKENNTTDMVLTVRSQPIDVEDKKFLLIFLQDITLQEKRAALERTFFHDMNNMVSGLVGLSELISKSKSDSQFCDKIIQVSLRIANEIEIQRILMNNDQLSYIKNNSQISALEVINELKDIFLNHNTGKGKTIIYGKKLPQQTLNTDISLLLRILCNMITNALESTKENESITVNITEDSGSLLFSVWNKGYIPKDLQLRVFQRNFTTKSEPGRGIGTYSMKLFGESILGGKVYFTTSKELGTTFNLRLNY